MAQAKSEFKQQKNIPIKNKKIKKNKIVKPQKIKSNPKKFVKLANESMQSQVKAAAGNQGKKSLGVKRKQQDVDNGVKKFKNNKDQSILRVHNSNNTIQKEVKDSSLKLIKSSGSLKQDNLKIQSLDAKKKSVVKMGKVETSEQNTDIKKMDIKSSHCSESIEKIPSAQQATGCRKGKNKILKQMLENTKQEPTQPNPSKQKTVAGSSKDNFTQLDNAEKILLVQKVRSRRRKKQAMSQIVTQLSTVKHGFPNNKNSSEEVENMKPTQPQPKLKEKSVQKSKNVKEIVVAPISDTYLFGSLKVKQGGIHKKDKQDDCLENLKKQKNLNIVQEPIQQTTNSLKKKSDTSLDANQKQNEQFNCEKIPKENRDMENSKRSKPQNLAQQPIKPEAIKKSQSGLFPKISPIKQVQIGKQDRKTKEKQVNFSEELKSILQKQMINIAEQKKTEEDKQNILKEIEDNLESIAQKSIKEKDSDSSQSGLKKKKKHDKCEKISKGSKPENQALNPIKMKKAEASLTWFIEEIVPEKQVLFEKQNQDTCGKKSEDKRDNFKENLKKAKFENIEQEPIQQSINDQKKNSLTLQDIIQNQSKENNNHKMLKENQDTYVKISKGSKSEHKALKPIKMKKAEASLTWFIEEIVPEKQVLFEKQNQDTCGKKSEDKQVNFSKKFKSISQKQVQQMINNVGQKNTEEDKQNILNEIQDNLEKKSRGSKPESIAQKSIKEKDSERSQSGLRKKEKHVNCEKISKGSKRVNKALKPIKRKKAEASLNGLIEEIVPVKQVFFEKQNQDCCEKKSEDKQDSFKENLKEAKFENIEQETIQQSINDQKKNSLTLQNQKEENNHKMLKENRDTYVKISKVSKPENKALKPIKIKKAEASLTWFIEDIVPVKQAQFQKHDQDSCEKKSEEKQVNFSEKFKSISQKQIQQEDKQNILREIQDNLEKKSGGSKPESIAHKSIKEKDSYRSQSGLKKKEKHDKSKKISKGSKPENEALKSIKRKTAEASLTGLIEDIVPVKQAQFQNQDQDSCEKNSEDKQVNFSEKLKNISQKQMINNVGQKNTEEDKQNILREIQGNLEKKSRGSKSESIAQKALSTKEKDSDRVQSGLKKKEKHDKCVKISEGYKPENEALKPIKRKTAETSLTGLIEEIVSVKQVQFHKQDQDSCENISEDKQVNFSEKFKRISQKQIQQMINNAELKKTEEDEQNILKEIQDNLEKKSRGFKSESIAQKALSTKEKDSDRAQSGLKKKEKLDKCEKISKGSKPKNKALKPGKTEEASLTKLIEEVVPEKQVLFEKQNQDSCEKKSEDKRDSFKENLKKAKFENIEQEPIHQSINDQKKNSLTLQNQKEENKMLKENRDTYVKISKGSKPGNTNLKPIKKRTAAEASLTGLIEKIVPVKQVRIQNWDQENGKNKSKEKYENITQELINKTTNGKQEEVQYDLIGRIVPIKPVAICKEINCETNLKQSKPENTTLHQNCVNNIKPEESFKAQISKSPLNQVYDDQSKQINCSEKIIEKSAQKLNEQVNITQEMRVETSGSGLIGRILPVMQVVIDEEENKRDSCTKNLKRKREPIEMQAVQLENNVQKVKSVKSEGKKLKISNLVKPTQLVAPGKVTICQSDTRITSRNCDNNISPLQQENSEQNQLHLSMDEMLNERWRMMKAKVEKSENKIRSQFMRCTEYVLTNEGTEELIEEPMQTMKADEIKQTSLIGKLKSLLKRRLTCHF
ncbi:filamin A-interacting protein 1-like isoform X2 [Drosophila albomicans]|uniref:Filamin A-interacting protein 1-like isoform X2 n=1 Tax=Drosophila albomicans TaxID=7291 RepID=A0A9C6T219_DROAB|nr:filamin A-interacting protein 1-like isoform X2 [Drosophila albomicans]